MRSQWADSERTLNVHWTCSERGIEHWGNWGKERIGGNRKKIQYLCFFLKITINCTDLLLFAAFWTVFNVCSMLRSLYVQCQLPPETEKSYKRPYTCVTLSDPTYPMLSRHTTYLDTPDWPGLFPSYLYPFAQVREAWSRAVSGCVGCECGLRAEKKKKCFSETVPWAKCSLCKSCKDKAAKAEFKIQPVTLPTPSFTDLILFTTGIPYALAMSWQWTYIERTLNMQWTRHRTLRKLRERANRWKSKENSIFVLFSENHNQLHRFAAICSFLDCVQCVFNVAFTVCSMSASTRNRKILQETIHLCNPVGPNLSHALQTHNIPWHSGLTWPIPFILISLCAGAWSMVACSEWVCWMWMWPAGRKEKEMLFRDVPWAKCSLCKSCKDKAAKAEFKIQPVTLPTPSFTDLILFTTGIPYALAMSWQWTYIERTLNMQWTRHRTLRKLRERANRWKSKENSIFVLFSENHNQLHRFAAICSFLDCVQCVFNVAFTVCSMSASTRNRKILQETIHLCNPVGPNLSHALQTHNIPWHSGLTWPIPFILISLCAGAWSMVACSEWVCWMWMWPAGRKEKEMLFRDVPWAKCSLCKSCKEKAAKAEFKIQPVTLPTPSFTDLILFTTGIPYALAMSWQWTYIERTLNMQWTRHRTLRKLRERANRWKSKENSIFVLFSENHNQLHRFAAICSFLDCVQCVFNVAFTVCSMSASTRNRKILQETIHLCNPVGPNLSHALQTHNIPWHSGLTWPIPFILTSLCAGAWSMVACSEWVCWMWMWPAGRKEKEMLFRDVPWAKCSLCKSCKDKAAKAEFKIQPVTLPTPSFTDLILFTTGIPYALAMSWQWTYIERTLNMQWTRHRTLRKLRERANRWKSKENSIFVLFSENHNQLHRFAAICSFLDCVQCVFNVAFTVCSMSASTRNRKILQETIHLCNPVGPNLSHALQTHNIPWHSGLTWPIPFILISLCAGAWSMVACSEWVCWMWMWPAGRKEKEMLFRDGWWTKSCTST